MNYPIAKMMPTMVPLIDHLTFYCSHSWEGHFFDVPGQVFDIFEMAPSKVTFVQNLIAPLREESIQRIISSLHPYAFLAQGGSNMLLGYRKKYQTNTLELRFEIALHAKTQLEQLVNQIFESCSKLQSSLDEKEVFRLNGDAKTTKSWQAKAMNGTMQHWTSTSVTWARQIHQEPVIPMLDPTDMRLEVAS